MEIWHAFLRLALDRPSHLWCKCLIGIPYIRWLYLFRMCNLIFKFFRCQTYTMCLGQCQSIILYIITYCTFNFLNLMASSSYHADHIYPENIFHTTSNKCTAILFRCHIQNVRSDRICRPTVSCLLTSCNNADSSAQTLHIVRETFTYETE